MSKVQIGAADTRTRRQIARPAVSAVMLTIGYAATNRQTHKRMKRENRKKATTYKPDTATQTRLVGHCYKHLRTYKPHHGATPALYLRQLAARLCCSVAPKMRCLRLWCQREIELGKHEAQPTRSLNSRKQGGGGGEEMRSKTELRTYFVCPHGIGHCSEYFMSTIHNQIA